MKIDTWFTVHFNHNDHNDLHNDHYDLLCDRSAFLVSIVVNKAQQNYHTMSIKKN